MNRQGQEQGAVTGGVLMVGIAAALWGTAGVASRWIHEAGTLSAMEIGFWRMALAVPLLFLVARLHSPMPGFLRPGDGLALPGRLLLMGLCLAGFQAGYFGAIAAVGVAIATLMAICTIPLFTALLAWPLHGERITARVALALGIAAAGTFLIVTRAGIPELPGGGGLARGLPMALGASLCFSVITLCGRRLPADQGPLWTATFTLAVAALALGVPVLASGTSLPPLSGPSWPALLWIALLPTALAYSLFYQGVRRIAASTAGVLILAEPLTANLLARWLHGEDLGPVGWLGAAMLLTAMLIMALRPAGAGATTR